MKSIKYLEKMVKGLIAIIVFVVPFLVLEKTMDPAITIKSTFFIIAIDVLFVIWAGLVLFNRSYLPKIRNIIIVALGSFFFALILSSLFGVSFQTSFWSYTNRMDGLLFALHAGLFSLIVSSVIVSYKDIRRLLWVVVTSGLLVTLLLYLGKDGLGHLEKFTYLWIPGATLANTTFTGIFLSFVLFFIAYLVGTTQSKKEKILGVLGAIFIFGSPLFLSWETLSQGHSLMYLLQHPVSLVGLAEATTISLWVGVAMILVWRLVLYVTKNNHSVRWKYLIGMIIIACVCIVSINISLITGGKAQKFYLENSTGARPIIWGVALKAIKDRPLFGFGPENVPKAYISNFDMQMMSTDEPEVWFDRLHNVFLDKLVTGGIFGVGISIAVIIMLFTAAIRLYRREDQRDKTFAVMSIIFLSIYLLELQTAFDTVTGYIILALWIGIFASMINRAAAESSSNKKESAPLIASPELRSTAWSASLVIALVVIFCLALPQFRASHQTKLIFSAGTFDKREALFPKAFKFKPFQESFLRTTSGYFIDALYHKAGQIIADPEWADQIRTELDLYDTYYKEAITAHPDNFRLILNYANLTNFVLIFGVDRRQEAIEIGKTAIEVAPRMPHGYWITALSHTYKKEIDEAEVLIKKVDEMNPDINYNHELLNFVRSQRGTDPDEIEYMIITQI